MPETVYRKISLKKVDDGRFDKQKEINIINGALARPRIKLSKDGFVFPSEADFHFEQMPYDDLIYWVVELTFAREVQRVRRQVEETTDKHFVHVKNALAKIQPWVIHKINGQDAESDDTVSQERFIDDLKLEDIDLSPDGWFDDVYDLDDQISVILSAIKVSCETRLKERPHILLAGPPACGKTTVSERIQAMLGDSRCVSIDGTTITKAGLEELLLTKLSGQEILMVLEEIEKAQNPSEIWTPLLQVMDQRATISKNNARSSRSNKCPLLIMATVNDIEKFKGLMSGALFSRFSTQVYFHTPTGMVLRRILNNKIAEYGGDPAWIEPCLTYSLKEENQYDPRVIIPRCIAGKDEWLSGDYARKLRNVRELTGEEERKRRDNILREWNTDKICPGREFDDGGVGHPNHQ